MRSDGPQLGHIADDVAFGLAVGHRLECKGHVAPVIGVGCCAGSNGTDEVAGLDGVDGRPTDARRAFFGQPARSHPTQFAAHPCRANVAGDHVVGAAECRRHADFFGAD